MRDQLDDSSDCCLLALRTGGSASTIFLVTPLGITYRIAGKFGGELNLAVWRIDQPTAKLKPANIKSFPYFARAKAIEVTW
jgi:hypothetical protein